jgi:tetratricopeptide (TPR) repeat protein
MASRKLEVPRVPFSLVAGLGVLATLIQLVPLPMSLVSRLSPSAVAVRLDTGVGGLSWLPLTLDVPATLLAALKGFSCLGILLVSAGAPRFRRYSVGLAGTLAVTGAAIALMFFAQQFLGLGVLGRLYPDTASANLVVGTFLNSNHAASFLTVAAFMAWGCGHESGGTRRILLWLGGLIMIVALFSTGSRAGVAGASIGALALAATWMVSRFGPGRGVPAAVGLLALGTPFAVLLGLSQRQLDSLSLEVLLGQKGRGWRDTLLLIADYPWVGVGRGAFEAPAAAYRSHAESVRLVFPENILLQMVSEWGLPTTVALIVLFVASAVQVVRRISRWEPVYQAAGCAVLAVLIHEFADFGLELPGVAFPTAMALGLVAGRLQLSRTTPQSQGRPWLRRAGVASIAAVWLVLLFGGVWAAPRTMEAEGARLSHLVRQTAWPEAELATAISRHPADYYFPLLAAQGQMARRSPGAVRHINRVQRLFPGWPEGHLMAANYLASLGRPSQAALEYRLARQLGAVIPHDDLFGKLGLVHLAASVPKRPDDLMTLGQFLAEKGHAAPADAATAEAVQLAHGQGLARMTRVRVALESRDRAFILKAASELAASAEDPPGLELAARALAEGGNVSALRALVERAIRRYRNDGALLFQLANALYRAGDLGGARALLDASASMGQPLKDQLAREKLVVEIELRLGHPEAAAAARARVRALGGEASP